MSKRIGPTDDLIEIILGLLGGKVIGLLLTPIAILIVILIIRSL